MTGALIGLETSGSVGSVAVSVDGRVAARVFLEEGGRHAGALPPSIASALDAAGIGWDDVSGIAVGTGPGSFTGVRVAAAAANGLAHALGCPVHPVSSLAAAALSGAAWPSVRRILFDARGDRLFTAVFEVGPESLRPIEPPHFTRLGDILTDPGVRVVCGDGAERHRDVLTGIGMEFLEAPAGVPTAEGVLRAVAMTSDVGSFRAGEWEPTYLRETGAVLARKARSR